MQSEQHPKTIFFIDDPRIRLNLGCGQRLISGFQNIDIEEPENLEKVLEANPEEDKETFFTKADVRNLGNIFEENYADEIHAYHLLEHFSFPEAKIALQHWLSVLKPGGVIVLELPDVTKCAMNLLQAHTSQDANLVMRMGLLGIYGEQDVNKPYMQHKFGYWPEFLCEVLVEAGFEGPLVMETKTKEFTRGVRDFRVEARKPNNDE